MLLRYLEGVCVLNEVTILDGASPSEFFGGCTHLSMLGVTK